MKKLKEARASKLKLFGLAIALIVATFTIGTTYAATHSVKSTITATASAGSIAAFPLLFRLAPEAGGEQGGASRDEVIAAVRTEATKAAQEKLAQFESTVTQKLADLQTKLDKANPDEFEQFKTAYETYKGAVDAALLELKARTETSTSTDKKASPIYEVLKSSADKIKAFKSQKHGTLDLGVTKATHTSTDIDDRRNWFSWHEGGAVGQIPVRKPYVRQTFRNITTGSEYIKYVDQDTVVRDAKNVALCGATTHNTKVTFKTYEIKIEKVRDFTHICLDMLDDYAFVEGEIRRLLETSMDLKIDGDLLTANGSSPNLHSIQEIASTFSAAGSSDETNYEDTVVDATIIDLLSIAGAQIRSFGANNAFNPNVILLNPRDAQLMKLLKDDQRNYIKGNTLRPSLIQGANGSWYIDNMLIIENSGVTANEAFIYDSTKGTVYGKPGVGIEFSYENRENFETETVTAKIYERLNFLVRNVDQNAFMHIADIEQGIADIDTVAT